MRVSPARRHMRAGARLLLFALFSSLAIVGALALADVTSTRESAADWTCCDDASCTKATQHARQDTAIATCVNRAADGKPRWVQGGRYRINVTSAAVPPPVVGAQLSWTAPTLNTDGSPITQALTYRVEQQAGTAWQPVATVTATSYSASTSSGCWRVVAIAAGAESDPTSPACKP